MAEIPGHAEVVIIGGGIAGCSTAFHLAELGVRDVVLIERDRLTCGTSFHAAGLVGQLRSNANVTALLQKSVELYKSLEKRVGAGTGWKQNGGLRLACTDARVQELERALTRARSFGLEMHLLTATEAKALWPLLNVANVKAAAYFPEDGQANPSDLTQALAKGARSMGARIIEGCSVTGIDVKNSRVKGVRTSDGEIRCSIVVNCAGQWAREIGRMAGVSVPIVSMQHQYLVTEPIEGVKRDMPTLRDPDGLIYFKEEVGGLVMGGYELNPKPWAQHGIPKDFSFTLLESDWDQFEPLMENAVERVPALQSAGIKELINGPDGCTPDGNFILGEAPEVRGFFVGAGFNVYGIAASGGAGWALANWVKDGRPPMALWPVDIKRFGNWHDNKAWIQARTVESLGKHYSIAWPDEEPAAGRPGRCSPLYHALLSQGARFGQKFGRERPNWFARGDEPARDEYSFTRGSWFDTVGEEHSAARESVAIFDQSSFAKFLIEGPDAQQALSWVCANRVERSPGAVTYTQLLDDAGGIQCDLTVTRFDDTRFYVVTGTGFASHDYAWIRDNIPCGSDVSISDVTDEYAVISLMGPQSRDVLARVCAQDVSNRAFPFAQFRSLTIAEARVNALRVTYVGELGWELHVPAAQANDVYSALMEAGKAVGIRNAGYRAIESLRLEKGYLAWGADITPDENPFEAGLGWAIKLKSGKDFKGRTALEEMCDRLPRKRLIFLKATGAPGPLHAGATLYRDDEKVGYLTSGGWGYTLRSGIGYGYVVREDGVSSEYLAAGHYQVEADAHRFPCEFSLQPLYDPGMEKIKA